MGNFSRRINSMFSSQKKVWTQLALDLGAELVRTGRFKPYEITLTKEGYILKLDSFTKMAGNHPVVTTRLHTTCENQKNLSFLIKRKNILNKKPPKGLESIQIDFENFDKRFRLFASNKREINRILNRKILTKIANQQPYKDIRIELNKKNIELRIKPLIKDLEQLKSLFNLVEDLRYQIDTEF